MLRVTALRGFGVLAATIWLAACGSGEGPDDGAACANDCLIPPAATCDGNTVVQSTSPGACTDGLCLFAESRTPCGDGTVCESGSCVPETVTPDRCDGVTCDDAPPATCDAGVAVSFEAPGTCEDGVCAFTELREDCVANGEACIDGVCVSEADACADVECPPITECEGEVAIRENGTCVGGTCSYQQVARQNCAADGGFCVDGFCVVDDPCEGVVCNTPPDPICNGLNAVSYDDIGVCVAGTCEYGELSVGCDTFGQVCIDAACVDRPVCFEVVCGAPPENECLGNVAYTYGEGRCELVTDEEGIQAEECVYDESVANCDATGDVCFDGTCVAPDPCLGVVCDRPETGFCEGELAVRYEAPGECLPETGDCAYVEVREDCAAIGAFCEGGECAVEDPCEGVLCNAPPAATCEGDVSTAFALPGVCVAGSCEYQVDTDDCSARGEVCSEGSCLFVDACADEPCLPPPAFCLAGNAVTFRGNGLCANEEGAAVCDYAAVQDLVNCSATDEVCVDGACTGAGTLLSAGALVISEFYVSTGAQWVELYNPSDATLDVGGLRVANQAGAETVIPLGTTVGAGAFLLVGSADDAGGEVAVDVSWGGVGTFAFGDTGSESIRLLGDGVVAELAFDDAWRTTARSTALDPTFLAAGGSSELGSWCAAVDALSDGTFGSPGSGNAACGGRFAGNELVINEIFGNGNVLPNGSQERWLELRSTADRTIDLAGIAVVVDGTTFRVPSFELAAGEYVVIGNGDRVAGRNVDLVWAGLPLQPSDVTVRVATPTFDGGVLSDGVLDEVTYTDAWPSALGASLSRASAEGSSTSPSNWCVSTTSYSSSVTSFGTPRAANDCR